MLKKSFELVGRHDGAIFFRLGGARSDVGHEQSIGPPHQEWAGEISHIASQLPGIQRGYDGLG